MWAVAFKGSGACRLVLSMEPSRNGHVAQASDCVRLDAAFAAVKSWTATPAGVDLTDASDTRVMAFGRIDADRLSPPAGSAITDIRRGAEY
jgi:hypothetical protein